MRWDLVEYTPHHRPAVLALMAEVQGHTTPPERFIWEFERNPVGETNVWLAVAGDEVIGVSCHNMFQMRLGHREEVVSFPLNVLTKAEHRGKGIFTALETANERRAAEIGATVMLSFPNAASTPIFLNRLGWLALRAPRVVARPRAVLPIRLRLPLSLEAVGTVDRWADEIWAENQDLTRCMVRDSTYLKWRFVACPDSDYRVHIVRDRSEIVGYLITATITKRRIRIAYIANALLTPPFRDSYPALRRAVLADARAPLLLDLDGPTYSTKNVRAGGARFFPLPKRLNLIAKPVGDQLDGSWLRAQPWFFQLGDLDFF